MLHGGPTHGGPGIMIVYDITNLDSFNHVENWLGEIAVRPAIPSRAPFQHATRARPSVRRRRGSFRSESSAIRIFFLRRRHPPPPPPPVWGTVWVTPIANRPGYARTRARAAHPCVCATYNMMRQGCGVRTAHAGAHVRRIRDQGCHRQQVRLGREADGRDRQRTGPPLHRTHGAPTRIEYPRYPLLL